MVTPFAYGGARIRWREGGSRRITLPGDHAVHVSEGRAAPIEVDLEIVDDARVVDDAETSRAMRWRWDGPQGHARSRYADVEIEERGPRRFVVRASMAPGSLGRGAVLSLLSTTLVERVAGLVLHATAVVLDGRAVLFIGPSGAGKTTSARHVAEASWLAKDRALVLPDGGGRWQAWGVPGGDDVPLSRHDDITAPLGAVLRVFRSTSGGSRIVPLGPASALLRLRESTQSGAADGDAFAGTLDAASALMRSVRVAGVEVALGEPLAPVLRAWLDAPPDAHVRGAVVASSVSVGAIR